MATKKQLDEQYALEQQQAELQRQQLEASYNLSQSQLAERETERKGQASKLAQQVYIQKAQTEKVMPNVLSAQGLSNTGYENVRKGQLNTQYQGQQGEIKSNLDSDMAEFGRQRASQNLNYQQNLAAWQLQQQAAAMDYRYALSNLKSSGGSTGSNGSYSSNGLLINQYGSLGIEQNQLSPDQVDSYTQQYVDAGYITQQEKTKLDTQLKNYAYTVNTGIAPITIPTVTPTTKTTTPTPVKKAAPSQNILKKALVTGQW